MKIKTTMIYRLTPVRMDIIKTQQTTHVGKDVEKREPFCSTGGNVNWGSYYSKQYGEASKN